MKILITESQMKRLLDTVVPGDDKESKKSSSIKEIIADPIKKNRRPSNKRLKTPIQDETRGPIHRS